MRALLEGSRHCFWRFAASRPGLTRGPERPVRARARPPTGRAAAAQVWLPWAAAVHGEVQQQLLLAALAENAAEPCSFGRPPPSAAGRRLPPLPPQPERLGVDRSVRPCPGSGRAHRVRASSLAMRGQGTFRRGNFCSP
jgi:hypothetical protein